MCIVWPDVGHRPRGCNIHSERNWNPIIAFGEALQVLPSINERCSKITIRSSSASHIDCSMIDIIRPKSQSIESLSRRDTMEHNNGCKHKSVSHQTNIPVYRSLHISCSLRSSDSETTATGYITSVGYSTCQNAVPAYGTLRSIVAHGVFSWHHFL